MSEKTTTKENLALEVRHVTKRFPGVIANDDVSFTLKKGEIHALLGENGAGKSTLMNVVYGLYAQDEGEFLIDNEVVEINGPNDAINYGIGMVHQHFMLVPVFTVTENMILGSEITKGTSLDLARAKKEILEISEAYGLEVDPDALIENLPVGVQQRVEILKALYRKANILVLDEPTAVLTPQEAEDLFDVMRDLTKKGVSIIFITHKLKEILNVADRVTVMRRGKVVGHAKPSETDAQGLATMMVGRDVLLEVAKTPAKPTEVVLEVNHLKIKDERDVEVVKDISFEVRAGEILGIAGIQGNGQTELIEAITGLRGADSGEVHLSGEIIPFEKPRYLVEHGMGHVPEDRHKHGLVLPYDLADNIVLNTYYQKPFAGKMMIRDDQAVLKNATELIKRFDVRAPSPHVAASTLSGGNQQKVIVAREFSHPLKVLIANQPTRGLDVGSIEYIHKEIINMRDEGVGVLVISAELDEILSLADRIAIMFRGEIVTIIDAKSATREQLGLWMAGASPEMS
ncbi:MAG: ABC transporter ATP-binding protein [Anaerolineae bacterium]|jgi:general nucleoside transport system ATP-binding protein|nr:ABC transporter ATP-binding protein [Anaerolineae bacterium]MBT7073881.1 ABC transporter ATP-binding protein [Anaerolineae bacterium]MBT7781723.1 ABC transporter ATP-binding protein [Anaerolineae bacterium]